MHRKPPSKIKGFTQCLKFRNQLICIFKKELFAQIIALNHNHYSLDLKNIYNIIL